MQYFYPWSAPVEFGKDAAAQGVYSLQHFRGEFWELRSLTDTGPHHHMALITIALLNDMHATNMEILDTHFRQRQRAVLHH